MAVRWTDDQQRVIDTRDKDILVSAAAGSGKTAVLVERIISIVCGDIEGEGPVDVDRLLVVTFTRAAAAEMRSRVGAALSKRLEADPEDVHLQRQQTLIHSAQITTIDSFCQYVVRSYFHRIDLDPSFRIGDEGELKLLKAEVLKELLEERYADEDEERRRAFTQFVETYAPGRSDAPVEDLILKLYDSAESYPDPLKWLGSCAAAYDAGSAGELEESGWMERLLDFAGSTFRDLLEGAVSMLTLTKDPDGPYMYQDALTDDIALLEGLCACAGYGEIRTALKDLAYTKLSPKKDEGVLQEKRDAVKLYREGMKKSLKALRERYFLLPLDEVYASMKSAAGPTRVLVGLTAQFIERYGEAKRAKNLADFQDVEHMALNILTEPSVDLDGRLHYEPTAAAKELSSKYLYIMTDEYQDSNLIQEAVLNSVSYGHGRPNIFMVGDVKQSIYRFRQARPELFMEKYSTYRRDGSTDGLLIDLSLNFRSRSEVLIGANYVFRKLMTGTVDGIVYDAESELHTGAAYPRDMQEGEYTPELLIFEKDAAGPEGRGDAPTDRELEAQAAAQRIRKLVGEGRLWDSVTGEYVPIHYRDIVILLRSASGWGDVYARVLTAEGIPAHTDSRTGYFDTLEVQTVMNLLKVVDNPLQDIPLAAVMKSPIGGFTDAQLAMVKSAYKDRPFHEACKLYAGSQLRPDASGDDAAGSEDRDQPLQKKLEAFYARLALYRHKASYLDIHELIEYLLDDTGYADYLAACPGGRQRTANIRMLVQKAAAYEKTSYRGLFNFVRYIEKLQSYDEDFGEAGVFGENEDAVRIMTIHKSKGLEFPVVIVGGLGKRFNRRDTSDRVVTHSSLGIGVDDVDLKLRTKTPTLHKRVLQKASDLEMLGEEMRILYVAMTRAKEKLILLGSTDKLPQKLQKYRGAAGKEKLGYGMLTGASSYLDWLLPAVAVQEDAPFIVGTVDFADEAAGAASHQISLREMKQNFINNENLPEGDASFAARLEENLSYTYPWASEGGLPVKLSVSELKRRRMEEDGTDGARLFEPEEPVPYIPQFISRKEEDALSGAERGTAYHRAMQGIDFDRIIDIESTKAELASLVNEGLLSQKQAQMVRARDIFKFAESTLGKRVAEAKRKGLLRTEQPFVISVPADELPGAGAEGSSEPVLIQGIIDVYFCDEDPSGRKFIVLADYKTDYVTEAAGLVRRYESQLLYYAEALERLTGLEVREKIIYSFCLGAEIRI